MFFNDKEVASSTVGQAVAKSQKDWEVGETVFGDITQIETDIGKPGSSLYSLKVRNSETGQLTGDSIKLWGTKVIDGRMKEVDAGVGSTVGIFCSRLKTAKNGNVYKDFQVKKYQV